MAKSTVFWIDLGIARTWATAAAASTAPAAVIGKQRLGYTVAGLDWLDGTKFIGAYHWFDAEQGGEDYGTELNLQVSRKVFDRFMVALKYARYDAEDFATDTEKLWFMVTFKY